MHYQITHIDEINESEYNNALEKFGNNLNYKNNKDIRLSLAGRVLLLRLIGKYYFKTDFNIFYNENGKPQTEFCYFSISHSGNYAACAVSDFPIGIDLQIFQTIKKRDHYMMFTDDECDYINNSAEYNLNFLEIWTMKESYIKAVGAKLQDMSNFGVISSSSGLLTKYNGYKFDTIVKDDFYFTICEKI